MIEGKARLALREVGFFPGVKAPACMQFDADVADIAAVQALHRKQASPDHQERALAWIIKNLCGVQQSTFHAGDPHSSAFAEGRRYVGLKLALAINLSMRDLHNNTGA